MIDWRQVDELRAEVGAEDFAEVVALFLEEVDEVVESLGGAEKDLSQLESKMHFLKGSAVNLGFEKFSQLCAENEKSAAAHMYEAIDIEDVLTCYSASRKAFLSEIPKRWAS